MDQQSTNQQFIVLLRGENNIVETVLNNDGRSIKVFSMDQLAAVTATMVSGFQVVELQWTFPP